MLMNVRAMVLAGLILADASAFQAGTGAGSLPKLDRDALASPKCTAVVTLAGCAEPGCLDHRCGCDHLTIALRMPVSPTGPRPCHRVAQAGSKAFADGRRQSPS
jgi:hypothetical protein